MVSEVILEVICLKGLVKEVIRKVILKWFWKWFPKPPGPTSKTNQKTLCVFFDVFLCFFLIVLGFRVPQASPRGNPLSPQAQNPKTSKNSVFFVLFDCFFVFRSPRPPPRGSPQVSKPKIKKNIKKTQCVFFLIVF